MTNQESVTNEDIATQIIANSPVQGFMRPIKDALDAKDAEIADLRKQLENRKGCDHLDAPYKRVMAERDGLLLLPAQMKEALYKIAFHKHCENKRGELFTSSDCGIQVIADAEAALRAMSEAEQGSGKQTI